MNRNISLMFSLVVAFLAGGYITWYYAQTVSQIYYSVNKSPESYDDISDNIR